LDPAGLVFTTVVHVLLGVKSLFELMFGGDLILTVVPVLRGVKSGSLGSYLYAVPLCVAFLVVPTVHAPCRPVNT
jgi:hypothetical protein